MKKNLILAAVLSIGMAGAALTPSMVQAKAKTSL